MHARQNLLCARETAARAGMVKIIRIFFFSVIN